MNPQPNPRIDHQLEPTFTGSGVSVHIVVNLEHWPFDQAMPRKLLTNPHGGADAVPDIANYSWVEYGMRAGFVRLHRLLTERRLPTACSLNASVIAHYPAVVEKVLESGWEIIAHGTTQRSLPKVDDERAEIEMARDTIATFTGQAPRGWLGPGVAETTDTPDHLASAGFHFTLDWTVDDVPLWMNSKPRRILAIPYTLELNDSVMYAGGTYTSAEFERRAIATARVLTKESTHSAKTMSLGLHPHLIAVPHRIETLASVLDHLAASEAITFTTPTTTFNQAADSL